MTLVAHRLHAPITFLIACVFAINPVFPQESPAAKAAAAGPKSEIRDEAGMFSIEARR